MSARDALLAEFDHEMAMTRHLLERVPDGRLDWRPHEKSYALGGLATHLAQLPHWGTAILQHDFHDLADARPPRAARASTREVLELFDQHVTEVRRALLDTSDAQLMAPWSLRKGEHLVLSIPRLSALRRFLLHHVIHHRGQLTVYLRMQEVPLPPLYGPTADEGL
jgi:uncharacterized damage-inducible protein DinB